MGACVRRFMGEALDQGELFSEVDSTGSVSALRTRTELTHISECSEVLTPYLGAEDLPF